MPVARVICSVILRVEVYDEADGAEARLAIEEKALASATAAAKAGKPSPLNPGAALLGQERPVGSERPSFALPPILPSKFSVTYNTFRRADELEITIPAAALPVPLSAIRILTCSAVVRQMSADAWGDGIRDGSMAFRAFANTDGAGDFEGIAASISLSGDKVPMFKIKFLDYVGLLASKQVNVGAVLDREIPVSEAIRGFLVGTPAEALEVRWVDKDNVEPDLGKGAPKAQKKGKSKKAAKPTFSGQKYLDVITQECGRIGCCARVAGTTIEVAFAGTMYEGQDRGGDSKATLLLGTVIEDIEGDHDLIGKKVNSVGVTSYDPDKGTHLMARWPPDPKTQKPIIVEAGKPPRLPPIAANVGLPGASQLDESILMVPIAPCSDPKILLQIAKSIFIEKARQKLKYKIRTHAPWANPSDADADTGPLLKLRAGDNVKFGVVAEQADGNGLIRPELRAIVSGSDAGATAALLATQGVKPDVASKVAAAIAKAPAGSLWRVDELKVTGDDKGATLDIAIVNFTVAVADLAAKAEGKTAGDFLEDLGRLTNAAAGQTRKQTRDQFQALFKEVDNSGMGATEKKLLTEQIQTQFENATRNK